MCQTPRRVLHMGHIIPCLQLSYHQYFSFMEQDTEAQRDAVTCQVTQGAGCKAEIQAHTCLDPNSASSPYAPGAGSFSSEADVQGVWDQSGREGEP